MAQIDASSLEFGYSAFLVSDIQQFALTDATADHYSWATGDQFPYFRVTLSSFDDGLNGTTLAGTVDTAYITDDVYSSGLSITDFDAPLASLVEPGDAAGTHQKFWETALAGATTVILPEAFGALDIMGDFVRVNAGRSATGAADLFQGSLYYTGGTVAGDALLVQAGATLRGGSDTFLDIGSIVVGDVAAQDTLSPSQGVIFGGADTITTIDAIGQGTTTFVIGDVQLIADGEAHGGADRITLRDVVNGYAIGDVDESRGALTEGGADTILIETTIEDGVYSNISQVIGDDRLVNGAGARATGAGDRITMINAHCGSLYGDFLTVNGVAIGGDDTISFSGTFASLRPTADTIAGDGDGGINLANFDCGDDLITITNAAVNVVSGDGTFFASGGVFEGGADTITATLARTGAVSYNATFLGDLNTSSSRTFTGGDDVITVDAQQIRTSAFFTLTGDALSSTTSGGASLTFGDDVILLTARSGQSSNIFGDASTVTNTGIGPDIDIITIVWGADSLRGGAGDDTIYGDARSYGSSGGEAGSTFNFSGGNDTLDGRGGDDVLFGGDGSDTVVFSLARAVQVNLNGIAGSSDTDLYEAIGQGNDRLTDIENVIGSSKNDVIVGNGIDNVIAGMAGADKINGRGGSDTASYSASNAAVSINLSTNYAAGGHAAGDRLVSIENVIGSRFADTLVGSSGVNALDGGVGADSMRGLAGSDSYRVDNAGDVVDESASGSTGTDLVYASISVNLANTTQFKGAVEDVTLTGSAFSATGNQLANKITGTAGGNSLSGGLGNDTLTGGGGADSFRFDTALNSNTNLDRITDFAIDDRFVLENAIFTQLTATGTLAVNLFKNTALGAIDADDRIIYNSTTGVVLYDSNGSASGGAFQFAVIGAGLALTNQDFFIV